MSDPVSDAVIPSPEARMDDIRAVMDAVGSDQAALMGISEGRPCAHSSQPRIRSEPVRSSLGPTAPFAASLFTPAPG